MKKEKFVQVAALLTALPVMFVFGALPPNYQLEKDWLLSRSSFVAQVRVNDADQTVTLSNGLIERIISQRLGTTIRYNNLMTGEAVIRAVEPEGSITIDGVTYPIGGAEGQPNKAFLTEEWLVNLKRAKRALRLIDVKTGEPQERLQWKRSRHHAPSALWPPPGKSLTLIYGMPENDDAAMLGKEESSLGRRTLFSDEFKTLDPAWQVHSSKAHPRSSFMNEAKVGEIYTPPNTAVFAERAIPLGAKVFEVEIDPGTDLTASWGPGIALVFTNGQLIKFHLRPGENAAGMFDGNEHIRISDDAELDMAQPWCLRFRLDGEQIHLDAKPGGGVWKTFRSVSSPANAGEPQIFRVGKMDKSGGASDYNSEGELVRLHINRVAFYGEFDPGQLANLCNQQAKQRDIAVSVHYEIYDGIPVLSKWITVHNRSSKAVNLERFNAETLSVVEYENQVETREGVPVRAPQSIHVETDMAFGGFLHRVANRHAVHWTTDNAYKTQVNYALQQLCLLKVEPEFGPDQTIEPDQEFASFRVFELIYDSSERERRGLALRQMYRTTAPWVTENPLMLHCRSSDEKVVRAAIDQAVETGFEMVILSFGSGFNAENDDPAYLAHWTTINDYAMRKGIHLGSYSLYSSRSGGKGNDIIPPPGLSNAHGRCPAITSEWGQNYLKKLYNLFDQSGFMVFENDGPYPGDVDVTARPPLQKGINDSRWVHWRIWTDFYKHLRSRGVYMNLPDYYYLSGANKCGMGYREVNWSLSREQQRIHTRQNIYDGTWDKTPSMGWMFVPLTQYHGGGAAATIEPLSEHLEHYESMMRSNLGLGVQACYRGARLYDTEATKQMVKRTVDWYKKHRTILESDMIHGRRADGCDLDWMLHVNPHNQERALLSVYNPTGQEISKEIMVPLYYAGLSGEASCSANGESPAKVKLDQSARTKLRITVPANGYGYFVFSELP
ncbi:MAG: hypothetical protein PHO37_06945 [Kiritimatiellae bacterium]|nr:hypothetical protein [Kiritimatiellia bacterium]